MKAKITEQPATVAAPEAKGGSSAPTCYVVQGGGTLEVGKEYEVRNERKGTFSMKVTRLDGEWITGTITHGVAKAMMSYNVRDEGEEVTVRDCHSYFIPIRHNDQAQRPLADSDAGRKGKHGTT